DVRAQDLEAVQIAAVLAYILLYHDRRGVRLLTAGGARAPDADSRIRHRAQLRHDAPREHLPHFRVPVELADVDGQRINQSFVLALVRAQQQRVVTIGMHTARAHAHCDPPPQATLLVPLTEEADGLADLLLECAQLSRLALAQLSMRERQWRRWRDQTLLTFRLRGRRCVGRCCAFVLP